MIYKHYLKSEHWRLIKSNFPKSKCFICREYPRDIHHKTYKRLGNEDLTKDLVYLCRDCHRAVHIFNKKFNIPGTNLFNSASRLKRLIKPTGDLSTKDNIRIFLNNVDLNDHKGEKKTWKK